MTKADLVEQVADAIGPGITKKDCALVVDGFLNAVKVALAHGENIEIRGFGTFKVRRRKTRMARNPRTGDPVKVPMRSVPVLILERMASFFMQEGQVGWRRERREINFLAPGRAAVSLARPLSPGWWNW